MPSGSLLSETHKGVRIGWQKWQPKTKYFSARQKEALRVILTRDIGMTPRSVEVLVNRPADQFQRIEEFIAGLIDSLWTADHRVFLQNSQELRTVRNTVRAVFYVGTSNPVLLVDQWKEWGNFLFHTLAATETIGSLVVPAPWNIFRRLNRIPYIRRIYEGDRSMLAMQHVSHLVSSRQMPYMGIRTELKARAKFKEVLTSDYQPPIELGFKLQMAARRIGGICRSIRSNVNPGASHISVTNSGEFSYPIAKGGQAKAVMEAMKRILLMVPSEDRREDTPFGLAEHWRGIPLWKTLFRKIPIPPDQEFLQEWYFVKDQPGRFRGLDEATGQQILYVAWKESTPTIVLRTNVVPEMGNKARHITLSDYWLNVLQAPLAHLLIDAMMYHPSVFSSFHRQDQAWEAVKAMCNLKELSLPPGHAVLSSDLKDATNAQQWGITKAILHGFAEGYRLLSNPRYFNLILDQIGPRFILFPDDTSVESKVGIMMGEAIAKPSLTLLNLAIEELTFLEFVKATKILGTSEPAPHRPWRFIHIGGDDHLVMGPIPYLRRLTDNHLKAGSHIDPGKHGFSRICVRYVERLINLTNLPHKQPFHSEDYEKSIIVDSVKVRLLERGQSTMIKKDNKNVAIGKSEQLGGCLQWLPNDSRFWTQSKKASIRSLFVERMGPLLPRETENPRAFAAIHLPSKIGGYGLGLKSELGYWLELAPDPHKWLISQAMEGKDVRELLRTFRRLNTNTSVRGVEKILDYQQAIIQHLREYPQLLGALSWKELREKFPSETNNARKTIALAADKGYLSIEEFAERVTRGNLFQELLMGKEAPKAFNTRKYTETYRYVWSVCEREGMPDVVSTPTLDSRTIARAIDDMVPQWWFDINQITTFDVGTGDDDYDFRDGTYDSMFTEGLPVLWIPPRILGVRTNRSGRTGKD